MGVTINFKGQLNSKSDYDEILKVTQEYADKHEMPYSFFEEENKLLLRVKDEKDWDYQVIISAKVSHHYGKVSHL